MPSFLCMYLKVLYYKILENLKHVLKYVISQSHQLLSNFLRFYRFLKSALTKIRFTPVGLGRTDYYQTLHAFNLARFLPTYTCTCYIIIICTSLRAYEFSIFWQFWLLIFTSETSCYGPLTLTIYTKNMTHVLPLTVQWNCSMIITITGLWIWLNWISTSSRLRWYMFFPKLKTLSIFYLS